MRFFRIVIPLLCVAPFGFAQMTPAQKTADFMQLAGLYAVNYAPYQLRRDVFHFNLYDVQPWLDEVAKSTDDVTFMDICARYVASLQDSHDEFVLPTFYEAWLHLDTDVFEGKVLIGDIDRSYLSHRKYPFEVGDEVVSVDGVSAADLIKKFTPYAVNGSGNPVSQARLAAGAIADRYESWNPLAAQIKPGDKATIVINRQSGAQETYEIPWETFGTPLTAVGLVPSPGTTPATAHAIASDAQTTFHRGRRINLRDQRTAQRDRAWGVWVGKPAAIAPDPVPAYMQGLMKLRNTAALRARAGFGSAGIDPFDNPLPVFNPPDSFNLRLGADPADQFVSGTFTSGQYTFGYIRIPTMDPPSQSAALRQYVDEIQYFDQNTDGLIVDVMGNGGGDGCYAETLASALIPTTFRGLTIQVRATPYWLEDFESSLVYAQQNDAPQWVLDLYGSYVNYVQQALAADRGMTGDLPACDVNFDVSPMTDSQGKSIAYSKPILVLTDNFTLSAAEIFAMFLQDSHRATIFGTRTDGGGGSVVSFDATDYSQGTARVTVSLISRAQPTATPGFPLGPYSGYYDGMGIYPDIVQDYQTQDNLLNGGSTFVTAATAALTDMIQKGSGSH